MKNVPGRTRNTLRRAIDDKFYRKNLFGREPFFTTRMWYGRGDREAGPLGMVINRSDIDAVCSFGGRAGPLGLRLMSGLGSELRFELENCFVQERWIKSNHRSKKKQLLNAAKGVNTSCATQQLCKSPESSSRPKSSSSTSLVTILKSPKTSFLMPASLLLCAQQLALVSVQVFKPSSETTKKIHFMVIKASDETFFDVFRMNFGVPFRVSLVLPLARPRDSIHRSERDSV